MSAPDSSAIQKLVTEVKLNPDNLDIRFRLAGAYEDTSDYDNAYKEYDEILKLKPKNARAHLNIGFIQLQQDLIPRALDSWSKAVELSPNIFNTFNNPETAFLYKSKVNDAIAVFTKQLNKNKDNAYAHHQLGVAYKHFRRLEIALQCFKTAVSINPNLWESYLHCGETYQLLGQPKLAIEQYKYAIQTNPSTPIPSIALAEIYTNENMLGLALKQIEHAISLDDKNPRAYYILGRIHYNQANFKLAILNFQKSLDLDTSNYLVHYNLAKACEAVYRLDFAITELERTIEFAPDFSEAYYDLGVLHIKTGSTHKAIENFENAARLNPKDSYPRHQLGLAYFNENENKKAIEELKKAVELNPMDSYTFYVMGQAYFNLKKYDKAVEQLGRAIKIKPDDASYYYQRANIELLLGNLDSAEKDLRQAASIKPSEVEYRTKIASVFLKKGRYDLAHEEMHNFLKNNRSNPAAYLFLSKTYLIEEDLNKAKEMADKVLEFEPNNHEAIHIKGVILMQKNLAEPALEWLNRALEIKPSFIPALCDIADLEIKEGKTEDGFLKYSKALETASVKELTDVRMRHARALINSDLGEEGIENFKKLIEDYPDNYDIRYNFAKSLSEFGKLPQAIEEITIAVEASPSNPEYGVLQGKLLALNGEMDNAKEAYYSVIRFYPSHIGAQKALQELFKKANISEEEAEAEITAATEKGELPEFEYDPEEDILPAGIPSATPEPLQEKSLISDRKSVYNLKSEDLTDDSDVASNTEVQDDNFLPSLSLESELFDLKIADNTESDFSISAITSALNSTGFSDWIESPGAQAGAEAEPEPESESESEPESEKLRIMPDDNVQENKEIQNKLLELANLDFAGLNISDELNSMDLGDFIIVKKNRPLSVKGTAAEKKNKPIKSKKTIDIPKEDIEEIATLPENNFLPNFDIDAEIDDIESLTEQDINKNKKETLGDAEPEPDIKWNSSLIKKIANSKNKAEITKIYEKMKDSDPCPPELIASFTAALVEAGFNDGAIEECKRTIEKWPENLNTQILLGKLFTMTGHHSMASLQYQKLMRKEKTPELHLLLGQSYLTMNNKNAAKKSFAKYLEKTPGDIDVFIQFVALLDPKDLEETKEKAEKFFEDKNISQEKKNALKKILYNEDSHNDEMEVEPEIDLLFENIEELDASGSLLKSLNALEDFDDE